MSVRLRRLGVVFAGPVALLAALQGARPASGAVSLAFNDKDATPSSTTVAAGSSFTFGVYLNESSTADVVTGLDYRFQASTSSVFRLTSRTSTSAITPNDPDNTPSVAPVTLSPTNGTENLGGTTPSLSGIAGVSSTDVADYSFLILSGTTPGTYTLYFTGAGTGTNAGSGPGGGPALVLPTYEGGMPNYSTTSVASDNTFTVTVTAATPEPSAALALLGPSAVLLALARTRRRNRPAASPAGC